MTKFYGQGMNETIFFQENMSIKLPLKTLHTQKKIGPRICVNTDLLHTTQFFPTILQARTVPLLYFLIITNTFWTNVIVTGSSILFILVYFND